MTTPLGKIVCEVPAARLHREGRLRLRWLCAAHVRRRRRGLPSTTPASTEASSCRMSWEEQGSEHTYRYRPLEGDPAVCALPPPLSTVLRRRLQHATALPGMRLLCLQTWKAPARDRL